MSYTWLNASQFITLAMLCLLQIRSYQTSSFVFFFGDKPIFLISIYMYMCSVTTFLCNDRDKRICNFDQYMHDPKAAGLLLPPPPPPPNYPILLFNFFFLNKKKKKKENS